MENEQIRVEVADIGNINLEPVNRNAERYHQLMATGLKTSTDLVKLERDMSEHKAFREKFITDIDLWSTIYNDNIVFKYYTIISAEGEDNIAITNKSYYKANACFYLNDGRSRLKIGMICATRNMTSISCGLGQFSYNINRRTQFAIGGSIGSLHSIYGAAEYRLTNTTSVKYRLNRVRRDPDTVFFENSIILREQLTEDFAFEGGFTRGEWDELKLTASKTMNILSGNDRSSSFEVESKIKKAIAEGTVRIKNEIGDYYSTQLEVSLGTSGIVPMFTISSDIYYNLWQIERLFKNVNDDSLEQSNSRMRNINAIFGISYGFDGIVFNFGFNLAGITVKFPILFTNEFPDTEKERTKSDLITSWVLSGIVVGFFLGTTYFFHKLIKKRREQKKKEEEEENAQN